MTRPQFILILSILLIGISACTKPTTPRFEKLVNVKLTQAKKDSLTLQANALYHNPNAFGGKVTSTDMLVYVNDIAVGRLNQTDIIDIPKNSEFEVPIAISFNPKQVFNENDGFLKQALKSFFNNELALRYEGTATMEILSIPFKVPIYYTDTISLKISN